MSQLRGKFWLACMGFAIFLCFPLNSAALDEVNFEALVDKEKVQLGENVQYLVEVNFGMGTMVPTIIAPSFTQFTILNEFQNIREKGEGTERYQVLKKMWLLTPNESGKLSIAAAIVNYQDPTTNLLKTGKTQVQFIFVDREVKGAETKTASEGNTAAARSAKLKLWGTMGGGLALFLLLALWIVNRRPSAPRIPPEDMALKALEQAIAHVEQGNLEAYYAALTRAFLDYLQMKFEIDGNVLATPALLSKMKEFGFGPKVLAELENFLKTADKAKFAGYVPNEDEMIVLHGIIKTFIIAGRAIRIKPSRKAKPKRSEDED